MVVPSPRWAIYFSTSDVYSGTSYQAGAPFPDDFTFHILAVPEPSTVALLAPGGFVAFAARRIV